MKIEELKEKHPLILRDWGCDPMESCMAFGIEVGDGWADLLDRLMSNLQWNTDKNGYPQVVADQIKEKFGDLRFYYHTEDTEKSKNEKKEWRERNEGYIAGMISFAETMSAYTCESCGKPGKISGGSWLKCRCEDCK